MKMRQFNIKDVVKTKYLFYTGKGGVGKTSVACATAVALADEGKKVLLVSTDPASNLQDVFNTELNGRGTPIKDVAGLVVANLDPIEAAAEYRESVVGPYRGKMPETVITNMEEQLSGSCTVEIAAFNEFSKFITDSEISTEYDHVLFDTAPTGHTLRMLELPSAWSSFIDNNTTGASCLGQLSGLDAEREMYKKAVSTLSDASMTTLVLVARPDKAPLDEAERASSELRDLGITNQVMVVNGVLETHDDDVSESLYGKQQLALLNMPTHLKTIPAYSNPLRSYNATGIENIRAFLKTDDVKETDSVIVRTDMTGLGKVIDDVYTSGKKVVFTMGKGGVGKTTVAAAVAMGLAQKGARVHLSTTDPAHHLNNVISEHDGISTSFIDEEKVLAEYKDEVLGKARANNMSEEDIAYIEEDLRSPCTEEIAVFRAFADIVERSEDEIVVIDTAPTGHTLLLLDSTQSYHKEVERTHGDSPESVKKLLPKLRDESITEVIIVTLAETTPVYEAQRLEEDLQRAGINNKWWVVNSSLYASDTENKVLKAKAASEKVWINEVDQHANGNIAVVPWFPQELKDDKLLNMMAG